MQKAIMFHACTRLAMRWLGRPQPIQRMLAITACTPKPYKAPTGV